MMDFDLRIFKVTIGVMRDHTSATHCIQVLRGHKFSIYPLTKRNYWRAVGMQLRLAGFTDSSAQVDGSAVEARQ